MSANDLIKQFQNGHFEFEKFCDIYVTKKKQNSWTMNIKQNVRSHRRIVMDDKFRTYKIQNGRQSALLIFFPHYHRNLA